MKTRVGFVLALLLLLVPCSRARAQTSCVIGGWFGNINPGLTELPSGAIGTVGWEGQLTNCLGLEANFLNNANIYSSNGAGTFSNTSNGLGAGASCAAFTF